ncbi:hypothetical protein, partial [Salmonella enterica]|uniref:hypothetical protein n=1 Tax=Salmonella enterica TaxID=28901 RepID=UPI001F27C0C2
LKETAHYHAVSQTHLISPRISTAACAGVRCQEAPHHTVTSDALSLGYRWLNNGFFFAVSAQKSDRTITRTACAAFLL